MNILVIGNFEKESTKSQVIKDYFVERIFNEFPQCEYSFVSVKTKNIEKILSNNNWSIVIATDDVAPADIQKYTMSLDVPLYGVELNTTTASDIEYVTPFDYIICHEKHVVDALTLDRNSIKYLPSIHLNLDDRSEAPSVVSPKHTKAKSIGVFLDRGCDHADDKLASTLVKLAKETREGFNWSCSGVPRPKWDIWIIATDQPGQTRVIELLEQIHKFGEFDNVNATDEILKSTQVTATFKDLDVTLVSSHHTAYWSLATRCPAIALHDKNDRLNSFLEHYQYHQTVVNKPLDAQIEWVRRNLDDISRDLVISNGLLHPRLEETKRALVNLLWNTPRSYNSRFKLVKNAEDIGQEVARKIIKSVPSNPTPLGRTIKLTPEGLLYGYGIFKEMFDESQKSLIVEIVSWCLTGFRDSVYTYGLASQLMTSEYKLIDTCEWIIEHESPRRNVDRLLESSIPIDQRKLDMTTVNNTFLRGYHRSGWNYVVESLIALHNPNDGGVIFDSYVDKTFGWEREFLETVGEIPYTRGWIGVLHHTPNTEYSKNNLKNVFQSDSFKKSLMHCKGLIVFSELMRKWVVDRTFWHGIPTLCLTHPTEMPAEGFSFDYGKFLKNQDRKIIQIGAWLRNTYGIFELASIEGLRKCALKGKGMNNYYVNQCELDQIKQAIVSVSTTGNEVCSGTIIHNCGPTLNKYVKGLIESIQYNHDSVEVLDRLTNDEYDQLLTENIVFVNLVDAAAVNTLIECIVRSTPIVINRLPATEEYLGNRYPLFYDSIDEIPALLSNFSRVFRAHQFLKNLDKQKYTIEYFIESLVSSSMYQELSVSET